MSDQEDDSVFIITDENNSLLHLEEVEVFGRKVNILAMFEREGDALEVLYAAETLCGLDGHRVRRVSGVYCDIVMRGKA
jgi:hypothetical protein